ncbi:MAG: hypothetical protein ACI89L_001369 [Phycisphaerales bacterium]|jgi:hypothetical protein
MLVRPLILSLPLVALVGCRAAAPTPAELASNVKSLLPTLSDQPWAGPGERAQLKSDEPRFDFTQTAFDATWSWENGEQYVDPLRVARQMVRELDRSPSKVEKNGTSRVYEFSDTVTIVCVNPVVVLIEPKPSKTTSLAGKVSRSTLSGLINVGGKSVELPAAFKSGTTVASLDGLRYYTKGQSDEPTPVKINEKGVGTIDVPWGTLEVRPDVFDGYSVRAIASQ